MRYWQKFRLTFDQTPDGV